MKSDDIRKQLVAAITDFLPQVDRNTTRCAAVKEAIRASDAYDRLSEWEKDHVQFPRLLAEVDMAGLHDGQYEELGIAMDLGRGDLNDLFERAHAVWNAQKASALPKHQDKAE
jgi:hypothetical protein